MINASLSFLIIVLVVVVLIFILIKGIKMPTDYKENRSARDHLLKKKQDGEDFIREMDKMDEPDEMGE
jgi:hypothetical protein